MDAGQDVDNKADEDGSPPQATWRLEIHTDPAAIDPAGWQALLDASPQPTPFLQMAWLRALHETGCASRKTGWTALFLTLSSPDGELRAACPLYAKDHSYGEYVFDWSWARACEEAGIAYYPRLLGAVPFTPVPGSRLLARDAASRRALLQGIEQLARTQELSSAHLLFLDDAEVEAARSAGWSLRETVQFHWTNRNHSGDPSSVQQPWADFDDFLGSLQRDKRKKIQQERRKVREAGVSAAARQGRAITPEDWDFFYRCYVHTYRAHHSQPYLSREFFGRVAQEMPDNWLMLTAEREGRRVAASLIALDPTRGTAWGRYWGAAEWVPCLHFEMCYYAPLAWCIEQGYARFEGGAQGEHKMARGLLPVRTWSAHWLAHPGLARAVADFVARESRDIAGYVNELNDHQPFKGAPEAGKGNSPATSSPIEE